MSSSDHTSLLQVMQVVGFSPSCLAIPAMGRPTTVSLASLDSSSGLSLVDRCLLYR